MHTYRGVAPALVLATVLTGGVAPASAQNPDGEALFEEHCAACHLGDVVPRALAIDNMRAIAPSVIVSALTEGLMQQQGAALSPAGAARRGGVHHRTQRRGGCRAGGWGMRPGGLRRLAGTGRGCAVERLGCRRQECAFSAGRACRAAGR